MAAEIGDGQDLTARANAASAQTTANSANSTANSAQTTANAANSAASNAQATANAALPTAGGTISGGLVVSGSFQNGPVSPGAIFCRFSRADSYTIGSGTPYGFLTANTTPTGRQTVGSGAATWSAEFNNRILCGSEINVTSDRRAKDFLGCLSTTKAMQAVLQVPVVTYVWDDGREDISPKVGFFAQDVALAGLGEAISTLPHTTPDGREWQDFHTIDKDTLLAVLWAAVQNLSARLELLEGKPITNVKKPIEMQEALKMGKALKPPQ